VSKKFLETIKALDGLTYHLEYHQRRLERVLKSINAQSFHNLAELLSPPKDGLYRCRVVYDAKSIEIEYILYKKREIRTLKVKESDTIEYSFKYEERDSLEELFKQKELCDDILIIKNGYVTDTSIANVAFFDGEFWLTPKSPLLCGVTRERLIEEGMLVVEDIRVQDIKRYKKIALMNAMIDFDIIAEENLGDIIC
jgi:4-amino-4-deoxychorismate lyase